MATFFHTTPSANRESITRHGLDWRYGGGGIAGSRTPEQPGVFLARDLWEAEWFARIGAIRFPALDVWEVTLEVDVQDDAQVAHKLMREIDGYHCWMEAIPASQLRLVMRDIDASTHNFDGPLPRRDL